MVRVLESSECTTKVDMNVQGVRGRKVLEQTQHGVRVRAREDGVSSVTITFIPQHIQY